jgi:hypothetical protein
MARLGVGPRWQSGYRQSKIAAFNTLARQEMRTAATMLKAAVVASVGHDPSKGLASEFRISFLGYGADLQTSRMCFGFQLAEKFKSASLKKKRWLISGVPFFEHNSIGGVDLTTLIGLVAAFCTTSSYYPQVKNAGERALAISHSKCLLCVSIRKTASH